MSPKKKILIIRFNSIGDIILTSPVIEKLNASGYEVHYLCKTAYAEILKYRPDIEKLWLIKKDVSEQLNALKSEKFDCVVDLHNNIRSKSVATALGVKTYTLKKPRVKQWLMTQVGVSKKPLPHIVDRFLDVIKPLSLQSGEPDLSYYPNQNIEESQLPSKFISVAVGAAFQTKEIPENLIINLIENIDLPFVLIGGKDDQEKADRIAKRTGSKNLTGQLSLSQSAKVIKQSNVLLTGDTGMMHLAAALNKSVVAVFGSTHPMLGYTPLYSDKNIPFEIIENKDLSCRPCTKQGKHKCPKGHFKCMLDLDGAEIVEKLKQFI